MEDERSESGTERPDSPGPTHPAASEDQRHGQVFKLPDRRSDKPPDANRVGRLVGTMGRGAGVVTSRTGDKCKYAGLHDLRRGFCTRWARRIMPPVLKRPARHALIRTTLSYYVDLDAEDLADQLGAKYDPRANEAGNTLGNNGPQGGVSTRDADAT
ncbi:MAG: hypothetical protein GYA33_11375 [Thermogutta sp.]|nr:hypothetical protein [Thermogutta sp.]